jgi:hypothetical protein
MTGSAICGFLISADVVNLAPHISTNPEWQLAIDQDPQMAVETRRVIFDRAVADKLTISGTHWLIVSTKGARRACSHAKIDALTRSGTHGRLLALTTTPSR